ncbi:hypothetical protein HY449_02280 [Candidatus Pacearchaeota archaeon]|nr:hypothetical protein [Candidatus Pacearchaeota archaeon]
MGLDTILEKVSQNDRIEIERHENGDFDVYVKRKSGFRNHAVEVRPRHKIAAFSDIDFDEWDELDFAIESIYRDFPEIKILKQYLSRNRYNFMW